MNNISRKLQNINQEFVQNSGFTHTHTHTHILYAHNILSLNRFQFIERRGSFK